MTTEQYFYNWYYPRKLKQIAGTLFLVSFLFLLLFRPFTVTESALKYSYLFTCFLHALSPALITFSYFNILIYFQKTNPEIIFIKAHVKIDDFNFNAADFLFERAEGNYVEITMQSQKVVAGHKFLPGPFELFTFE